MRRSGGFSRRHIKARNVQVARENSVRMTSDWQCHVPLTGCCCPYCTCGCCIHPQPPTSHRSRADGYGCFAQETTMTPAPAPQNTTLFQSQCCHKIEEPGFCLPDPPCYQDNETVTCGGPDIFLSTPIVLKVRHRVLTRRFFYAIFTWLYNKLYDS